MAAALQPHFWGARGSVEPGGQAGQINRVRQQISARLLVELAVRENQAHRLHGKPAVCQAHFVPQPTRNRKVDALRFAATEFSCSWAHSSGRQ